MLTVAIENTKAQGTVPIAMDFSIHAFMYKKALLNNISFYHLINKVRVTIRAYERGKVAECGSEQ